MFFKKNKDGATLSTITRFSRIPIQSEAGKFKPKKKAKRKSALGTRFSKKDLASIGRQLKEIRRFYGVTQKEIAEKLNLSVQQISKYETGNTSMAFLTAIDYFTVLQTSHKMHRSEFPPMYYKQQELSIMLTNLKKMNEVKDVRNFK